jgi:hypothetical protein
MGNKCCAGEYEDFDLDICLDVNQLRNLLRQRKKEAEEEQTKLIVDIRSSVR